MFLESLTRPDVSQTGARCSESGRRAEHGGCHLVVIFVLDAYLGKVREGYLSGDGLERNFWLNTYDPRVVFTLKLTLDLAFKITASHFNKFSAFE